jgi:hypothetical protein
MRLLYITTKTRFDLMFATNVLASRQHNCTAADEQSLAQLVAFAKLTAHWDYVLAPSSMTLTVSADASYACHPDGLGHSGFVCSIGGSTVYARSSKQKLVSKSSSESELLALNLATDETLYLRNLLAELGYPQTAPTDIMQDNRSAITMATKGELGNKRTKHFTVRHYFVTEHIRNGAIRLTHQAGTLILADGLTKPLVGPHARHWATTLLGCGLSPHPLTDQAVRGGVLSNATVPSVHTGDALSSTAAAASAAETQVGKTLQSKISRAVCKERIE